MVAVYTPPTARLGHTASVAVPVRAPAVAVMVALPGATAVTSSAASPVPTPASEVPNVTVCPGTGRHTTLRTVAVRACVPPVTVVSARGGQVHPPAEELHRGGDVDLEAERAIPAATENFHGSELEVWLLCGGKKHRPAPWLERADAGVPGVGLEPTIPCGRQILSLLRIPISPSGRGRAESTAPAGANQPFRGGRGPR